MQKVKSITYAKIGKNKAMRLAYKETGEVVIDERLKGIEKLDTLIHECLHCMNPTWGESKIIGHSSELSKILWEQGYRKVEL